MKRALATLFAILMLVGATGLMGCDDMEDVNGDDDTDFPKEEDF